MTFSLLYRKDTRIFLHFLSFQGQQLNRISSRKKLLPFNPYLILKVNFVTLFLTAIFISLFVMLVFIIILMFQSCPLNVSDNIIFRFRFLSQVLLISESDRLICRCR